MYIVVIGGGKVGYYLSFALLSKGHEVLIIEREAGKCKAIAEDLGSVVMHGDGAEVRTLEDAGAGRADLLVSVTRRDEVNLVACQVAKHKFGIRRTIARVSNPKNEALFKMLGIDVTVSSTSLILEQIEERLPSHSLAHLFGLEESGLELVEVNVEKESPSVGKKISDISLPAGSLICLIINAKRGPKVPAGNSVIEAGDNLITVTKTENDNALKATLTG